MAAKATSAPARMLGQYAVYGEIAAGGMATIHFGRLLAPNGYARTVAIKRLHPQFAKDAEFRTMFLDEARVAVHVTHPNVVATLDVVGMENELFLVMEYVPGESLSKLIRLTKEKKKPFPPRIAAAVMAGALRGLHAAHEARDAAGNPLQIVHRDISPQNILVGTDGVGRVLDFGVAKAVGRHQQTREGQLKGKIAYMAPEQLNGNVSPQTDIYAAGVTLWESLTSKRLFSADNEAAILGKILSGQIDPPSTQVPRSDSATDELLHRLDGIVLKALERDPARRWKSALEMAEALERLSLALPAEVGRFTEKTAHDALKRRATTLTAIEKSGAAVLPPASRAPGPDSTSEPRTQLAVAHSSHTPPAIEPPRGSTATTTAALRRRSNLLVTAGVLAIALLFAAVGAIVAVRSGEPSSAIPPARATAPPAPPEATTPTAPEAPSPPDIEILPTPSGAPTTGTAPPRVRNAPPRKPKCDPVFTDDKGHKQYRPECLEKE